MDKRSGSSLSRRQFIGRIMFASTGAALISSCSGKSNWQIGCFTRPWSDYDYRVAFDGIAGAGFKYVGLMNYENGMLINPDTTPEYAAVMGEEAKARGLTIASAYGRNFDVRNSVQEGVSGLQRLIDSTAACECPHLVLGGISSPELTEAYYEVIAECCDYAAEKKVFMSIKPHGGTNATGPECRAHIEMVGHRNFGLWYDPGNIYYYSEGALDPVDDASEVDGLVLGMSVKDFQMPREVNLTPGTGMVDFPEVFNLLKQGGFRGGPLIVECLTLGDLAFVNTEARKARQFLEELTN
jgi:sugar phosphate isomerase/epimerase